MAFHYIAHCWKECEQRTKACNKWFDFGWWLMLGGGGGEKEWFGFVILGEPSEPS